MYLYFNNLPTFNVCSYMKDGLHAGNKMNSLARSNASLYGNKDDLYDRLRRHAYQGKKSGTRKLFITVEAKPLDVISG